ncbi:hypothetical protein GOB57_24525 [Sinorhizobium meliloti]|nr:hypothetical protein [Sinorhizobium meliloti]
MSDIDLSAVSTYDLLRELSGRLVGIELRGEDREDRWKAPEQIDVVHAVLKLLAQPRLPNNGGWPTLSNERLDEFHRVVALLRQATMEPDPDGDHVLRVHYEVRSEGYLAAVMVPHDILTTEDVRTAQHALTMLGNSVNRIATALSMSVGHFVKDIELTPQGQQALAERNAKAKV